VQHAPALLYAKLAKQDMDYKVINVTHVLPELI